MASFNRQDAGRGFFEYHVVGEELFPQSAYSEDFLRMENVDLPQSHPGTLQCPRR